MDDGSLSRSFPIEICASPCQPRKHRTYITCIITSLRCDHRLLGSVTMPPTLTTLGHRTNAARQSSRT